MAGFLLMAALGWSGLAEARGLAIHGDRDGDGLTNGLERSLGSNPFVADSDADGWTDWEEYVYVGGVAGTDPNDTPDDDGDSLYDVYEVAYGTDDTIADTDGDGWTDWEEYVFNSDGTDAASTP